jgi:hypothetical protein
MLREETAMTEERFTVSARPDNAGDVFHHPYAYARPLAA